MRSLGTMMLLLALTASATTGQLRRPALFESGAPPAPRVATFTQDSLGRSSEALVFAGLVGGAMGLIGGAYAGYLIETASGDCRDEYFCGAIGVLLGAVAGEAALLSLGVHLANGRLGPYLPSAATNFGIAVGGVLLAFVAADVAVAPLVAVPVVQLINAIRIERQGSRPH